MTTGLTQNDSSASKIKLLLFTNSVAVGGMEEHVKLLARYLDRDQFDVFAICPDWKPTEPFCQSLSQVVDHLAQITPDRRYGSWRQIIETIRLIRQLRAWHIQVMHMHSTTYHGQILAMLASKIAGVKRIYVTEHLAPETNLPLLERLSRDLFSFMVSGIVSVSEKNYRARVEHIYTPHDRTIVVANGVDVKEFPSIPKDLLDTLRVKYALPADAQVIGTVVRFEPEKGLNDLIAALPSIRAACPQAHLLMVGDGSLRAALEQQASDLGVREYVHFTGFQSNPRPFLGLMDAFVLPVPVGSMSIGLLEAMAMRRAVVITFGGKGEAVIHGESGFCAEPRNPESIAHFVIQILQNPDLQLRLGETAYQRVEEEFSAQRVAQVLGQLYRNGKSKMGSTGIITSVL
jgi:glycosyltransferase involved in cell wall biosynthesis